MLSIPHHCPGRQISLTATFVQHLEKERLGRARLAWDCTEYGVKTGIKRHRQCSASQAKEPSPPGSPSQEEPVVDAYRREHERWGRPVWLFSGISPQCPSPPALRAADITACFWCHSRVYDSIFPWVKKGEWMNSRQGSRVPMTLNMDQGSKNHLSVPLYSRCFCSVMSFQSSSFQSYMNKDLCPYTCIMVGQINHPLAALSQLQMNYHKRLKDRQVMIIWRTKGLISPTGMYLQSLIWSSEELPSLLGNSNELSAANAPTAVLIWQTWTGSESSDLNC